MTDNIMDLLAETRDKYLQVEGRAEQSVHRHRQVLEAIKAGDQEGALMLMRDHLMDIERSLFPATGTNRRSKAEISDNRLERR